MVVECLCAVVLYVLVPNLMDVSSRHKWFGSSRFSHVRVEKSHNFLAVCAKQKGQGPARFDHAPRTSEKK